MFGLTAEDWAQTLGAAERGEGPEADWERASDEEQVRARKMLVGLRMFHALYVLHGLRLPDTPAQAALRQRIDDWNMFPFLDHVIATTPPPGMTPSPSRSSSSRSSATCTRR
ncbi:hypothetical protein [Streptomyces sp. NPDC014793]|uniref:hypothetical protein n=1 Tax=Streptomyces sp. NPDC014793 TaxID=3364914 RepID=UPI0036FF8E15